MSALELAADDVQIERDFREVPLPDHHDCCEPRLRRRARHKAEVKNWMPNRGQFWKPFDTGIPNALPLLWLRREPKFLRCVQALERISLIVRIVVEGGYTSLAKTSAPLKVKAVVTDRQVEFAVRSSHKLGGPTYKFRTSPEELELGAARSIGGKVLGSKLKDKCPSLRARQNLLDGLLAGR